MRCASSTPPACPTPRSSSAFEPGKTALDLPIFVYETTTIPPGIRAERVHYIVEFDAGRALIAELIVLSLDGNKRTWATATTCCASRCPRARRTSTSTTASWASGSSRSTTGSWTGCRCCPGQNVRQILFRYALPYQGTSLDLVRSLPYPAAAVNALVADAGEKVTSPEMTDGGRRETQNGDVLQLHRRPTSRRTSRSV